jgi:hypothetical protein
LCYVQSGNSGKVAVYPFVLCGDSGNSGEVNIGKHWKVVTVGKWRSNYYSALSMSECCRSGERGKVAMVAIAGKRLGITMCYR